MAEALLERELRRAMQREEIDSLPIYPEGRPCRRPAHTKRDEQKGKLKPGSTLACGDAVSTCRKVV